MTSTLTVNHYYPYGVPFSTMDDFTPMADRRLYGDKEQHTFMGYNTYDYSARHYYAAASCFDTPDPLTGDYTWVSPYTFCAGNPVKNIDPSGKDIVVLNYTEGEHMAMLIQNEDGKWQYYSINGDNVYISGEHSGGRPFNDVAVGTWDSPEEFFESSYNERNEDSKEDSQKNHFGFSEGFQISTTPEQDAVMRNDFTKIANSEYNLFTNNCTIAVQKVMVDAGIPVSKPTMEPTTIPVSTPGGLVDVFNGYKMKCDISILPSSAFKSIMKWNPDGRYIHK